MHFPSIGIGIGIVKSTFQVLVLVLVLLSSSAKVLVLVLGRNFGIGQLWGSLTAWDRGVSSGGLCSKV